MAADFDAIVLAGGRARRFGADKLAATVDGRAVLDLVLEAVRDAGRVVVVGPRRPVRAEPPAGRPTYELVWCREDPAGSGPLAAVAAGAAHVERDVVALLGGDMPLVGSLVPLLVEAAGRAGVDGAVAVDGAGGRQPLACALRRTALADRLAAIGDPEGKPLRRLLDGLRLAEVPGQAYVVDVDTAADLERAREHARTLKPQPPPDRH